MKIKELCQISHDIAKEKGFWDSDRNNAELLMLIVTELSECCEGLRTGNNYSDHIPPFSFAEEELADAVIRICDMAKARDWDLEGAITNKLQYNKTRPQKHDKEF